MKKKSAIILLSGGLDSATIVAMINDKFNLHCLTFDYEQRHKIELESAKAISGLFGVQEHKIIKIDPFAFTTSSLFNIEIPIPEENRKDAKDIPSTYVPARNVIFLSYALSYAESIKSHDIFIGTNAVDYSGYPDCRPEFIKSFELMANHATSSNKKYNIHSPLMNKTKKEIIKIGNELGMNYSLVHSCYNPIQKGNTTYACKKCDACFFRLKGFEENDLTDPYLYH